MDPIKKTGVHKIKIKHIMIILLFLSGIALIPSGYAEDWILEKRGDSYEIFYNSANPSQKRWNSAPMWVLDPQTDEYEPYVFEDKGSYYTVRTGLIGAKIQRGKAVFYTPNMDRMAVGRETWLVFQRQGVEWIPVCASLLPYYQNSYYSESADFIEITGEWATQKGNLNIVYHFEESLKHTVKWTPNESGIYALVQFWNNTHYSDVTLGDGTKIIRTQDDAIIGKTDSLTFLFGDDTQPFGVFESQYSASDLLHKTIFAKGTVNYEGITITDGVAWIFYNSTLCTLNSGETLEIDPTTSTFNNPTEDGYIRGDSPEYIRYNDAEYVYAGFSSNDPRKYRGYFEWDISSIPDGSTITDTIFKYEGFKKDDGEDCHIHEMLGARPSTSSDSSVWAEIAEGTVYADPAGFVVIGTNKQVDLGSSADSDLESQLTSGDWFAIGIQRDSESTPYGWNGIRSEEYAATPDPTLYVEYTLLEEIQVQYYTVTDSRVNINDNVNIDIQLNYTSDYAPVIDGTVTVNGISASHQGTGTWRITQSKSSVQGINYNTVAASGNSRGISDVDQNGQSHLVIWDRFIVNSIWVSEEVLFVGQTVYIYISGYLDYGGHDPSSEDSLVISGISFSYDWENTRWYATDSRETEGENVYDTLTSCEEITYNITVGTMDGKSASATWSNSVYEFFGPYYENGSNADPMNITLIINGISESIYLDGNYTKYTTGTASLVTWALTGGGTRYYQINSNNETIYIFIPEATYSTYTFTIYCYSAGVPGYLESNRYVNGTRRMVERKLISAEQNQVPMLMIVGEAYFMSYDAKDGLQYDLGIFVPGSLNPTYTITRSGITSAEKSVYRWIKVTKSRSSDNTQIEVNYKDELDNTTWLDLEILYLNGTIAYETNITDPNMAVQFQWNSADNETEYLGILEIEHGSLGDYTHRMTFPLYTAFSRPFDLGFLGSIGLYGFFISDLISIGAIIGVATVFSTKEAVLGAFTITILTFAFIALGWVDWGYGLPILAFLVVILMGINEARKDR